MTFRNSSYFLFVVAAGADQASRSPRVPFGVMVSFESVEVNSHTN